MGNRCKTAVKTMGRPRWACKGRFPSHCKIDALTRNLSAVCAGLFAPLPLHSESARALPLPCCKVHRRVECNAEKRQLGCDSNVTVERERGREEKLAVHRPELREDGKTASPPSNRAESQKCPRQRPHRDGESGSWSEGAHQMGHRKGEDGEGEKRESARWEMDRAPSALATSPCDHHPHSPHLPFFIHTTHHSPLTPITHITPSHTDLPPSSLLHSSPPFTPPLFSPPSSPSLPPLPSVMPPSQIDSSKFSSTPYNSSDKLKSPSSSSDKETIIIFDWDDTLLASSFLSSKGYRLDTEKSKIADVEAGLRDLEQSIIAVITLALQYGEVHVVTNAETGWVQLSAAKFIPAVVPLLSRVSILSARSTYEGRYPDAPLKWKYVSTAHIHTEGDRLKAIAQPLPLPPPLHSSHLHSPLPCVFRYYAFQDKLAPSFADPKRQKNIISFGDSHVEREAVRAVTRGFPNTRCKSVKFAERPSMEQLRRQIELVTNCFQYIHHHDGDLDLQLTVTINSNTTNANEKIQQQQSYTTHSILNTSEEKPSS